MSGLALEHRFPSKTNPDPYDGSGLESEEKLAMTILISILTLYPWVLVTGLIYVLIRIARFYQRKYAELYKDEPGHQTYHPLFLIPLSLFLIAAARYAFVQDIAGDLVGDGAFFAGGIVLAVLGYRLQRLMTGGRR